MTGGGRSVLVAMSGGVDSSVAAHLLREAGWEVTGVHLCLGGALGPDADAGGCCGPAGAADARRVADALGMDLHVLDAGRDFARVIDDFVAEYARGRTPNPCVHCNVLVKFGRLISLANRLGAARVATGHHARLAGGAIRRAGAPPGAAGSGKDQSYALFALRREQLPRILLPIGDVGGKAEVRRIAAGLGLHVADKPDSQDVCFADGRYVDLLRRRAPEALRPGEIVDADGNILGVHDGVGRFTVGQRRGLGVAAGTPLYVTRIDPSTARITVGGQAEVMATSLTAGRANWHIAPPAVGDAFEATVQIRYNHPGAAGRVRITGPESFRVDFDDPVAAVTPGQAAVVYDGDRLLGGGWIE